MPLYRGGYSFWALRLLWKLRSVRFDTPVFREPAQIVGRDVPGVMLEAIANIPSQHL